MGKAASAAFSFARNPTRIGVVDGASSLLKAPNDFPIYQPFTGGNAKPGFPNQAVDVKKRPSPVIRGGHG